MLGQAAICSNKEKEEVVIRYSVALFVVTFGLSSHGPLCAQAQSESVDLEREYGSRIEDATPLLTGQNDHAPAALRQARARTFNSAGGPPLAEYPPGLPGVLTYEDSPLEPLPFRSDWSVVLGHVVSRQAYLSEDGRKIYTEYLFAIHETVFSPAVSIPPASTITILTYGGAVRRPDGRVLQFSVTPNKHLRPGERYLLFLSQTPKLEAFFTIRLWRLKGGFVAAEVNRDPTFRGWSEERFLAAVREGAQRAVEKGAPKSQTGVRADRA